MSEGSMKYPEAERCLGLIGQSPSSYHVTERIELLLKEHGYTQLQEQEEWRTEAGGRYYVVRNGSSILSFRLPAEPWKGFRITASHSDFPCFKIKENPEITAEARYVKLNTEPYGGMIRSSWLDRCLSVAGRIVYEENGALKTRNVALDRDLMVIPSLAIHMNREVNKGVEYNLQSDLQPLFACAAAKAGTTDESGHPGVNRENALLDRMLAQAAGVEPEKILGKDIFLYVREPGRLAGADEEFILSPRLDDLLCVYASLEGFLAAEPREYAAVHAVFDNEEVGSTTKQGAASTFLRDTLERIAEQSGKGGSGFKRLLAESFLLSADNAHAVHPNYPDRSDPTNRPYLNGGIVIKYHGGQKYTTDGYSEAVVKRLCRNAGIPWQTYYNRSDLPGGSTLGNLSSSQVSVPAADIGIAQLAMHAAVETAGSRDVEYLVKLTQAFYSE